MAFTPTSVPNDLIPYNAGIAVFREIAADGTKGTPYATNYDFVISATVSTSRETDTLTNGNGSDKEYPSSETQNLALVVNTYNELLHAVLSGRSFTIGTQLLSFSQTIGITKNSSDAYVYTFTDTTVFPDSDSTADMFVMNTYNQPFEQVSSATSIADGQFYYDSDTKTITVASTYEDTNLTCVFKYKSTTAIISETKSVLVNPSFEITLIDIMQSAATSAKYNRTRVLGSASITGDLPEAPSQKDINTSMTYNFATDTSSNGSTRFTETISEYVEV